MFVFCDIRREIDDKSFQIREIKGRFTEQQVPTEETLILGMEASYEEIDRVYETLRKKVPEGVLKVVGKSMEGPEHIQMEIPDEVTNEQLLRMKFVKYC